METTYRNTDLDLVSAEPLGRLSRHLVAMGMVELGSFQDTEGRWHVSFEIIGEEDDRWHESGEATILAMLDILEKLLQTERALFDQCRIREFNVAYDIGDKPRDSNEVMAEETLARMVALKGAMRITLYPEFNDDQR